MTSVRATQPSIIEWGWAGSALEVLSGDLHVVAEFGGGALVGLLDGLGHGVEAAEASGVAASLIGAHASESVLLLVQRCHAELRKTRGAVMSLASFNCQDASMTWLGVGNVETLLLREKSTPTRRNEAMSVHGGVVGYQLPPLRPSTFEVSPGDTLIMATDGIENAFTTGLLMQCSAQEIAESIVARFAKTSDDAHVVVARYLGA